MKISTLIIFSFLITLCLYKCSRDGCVTSGELCRRKGGVHKYLGNHVYICVSKDGRIIP